MHISYIEHHSMDADLSTYQTLANEFHYSVAEIELIGCYFITEYPEIVFWSLFALEKMNKFSRRISMRRLKNCTLPPHPESARSYFPLYHIHFFKRHAPYMRIQRKHRSINPVQNDARLKQPDGAEARRYYYYLQPPSPSLRRRRPRCGASAAATGR